MSSQSQGTDIYTADAENQQEYTVGPGEFLRPDHAQREADKMSNPKKIHCPANRGAESCAKVFTELDEMRHHLIWDHIIGELAQVIIDEYWY